jgi:hypothetical protein
VARDTARVMAIPSKIAVTSKIGVTSRKTAVTRKMAVVQPEKENDRRSGAAYTGHVYAI